MTGKTKPWVPAILILLLILPLAAGQTQRKNKANNKTRYSLFMETGMNFLLGRMLDDMYRPALHLGAGVEMSVTSHLSLRIALNYYQFKYEYSGRYYLPVYHDHRGLLILSPSALDGGRRHFYNFYSIHGEFKMVLLKQPFSPYFTGGMGFAFTRSLYARFLDFRNDIVARFVYEKAHFSLSGGAGVRYRLSRKLSLYFESGLIVFFHSDFPFNESNKINLIPVKVGFSHHL